MKASTERFSNRIENYVRYRPDYPAEGMPGHDNLTTLASELFNQYEVNGSIRFDYNTRLFLGRLNPQL